MPYLTYTEYQLYGTESVSEEDFPKLVAKASDVLDNVTRAFYMYNDIEEDVEFRRTQFKKAVAAQIDYFIAKGGTSAYELNTPLSVTIGRTQMSTGASNQNRSNSIVSEDVYMLLRYTGLLYAGVGVLQC